MWQILKSLFRKNEKSIKRFTISREKHIVEQLDKNVEYIKKMIALSDDFIIKDFYIGEDNKFRANIIFLSSIIKSEYLNQEILKPLMLNIQVVERIELAEEIDNILTAVPIPIGETTISKNFNYCIESILNGYCLLLIDGIAKAFLFEIKGFEGRSLQVPIVESTSVGPQEAFNENLNTNLSLIRKRLKDNNLMVKMKKIGDRTKTDLALIYINDIADKELISKIKERLENIDVDGILSTGQINQYIEDNWVSIFPQVQTTERPDKVVANLLEGRIILLLEGTPFASILPTSFIQFFQSPEDYYSKYYIATFLRILRFIAVFITVSLPSIYISLVSFHHELLPRDLAITISRVRQDIPFPSYLEALIMEMSLEFLREAGLRVPGPIGQTVGIVGGLILGQAAVNAGIVSPPMVIVVGLTAIASFILPSNAIAIPFRLLRFPMMIMASIFGVYGIMIGWLAILIHLCSLESLEQPYFAPFAPINLDDLKDSILRAPLKLLSYRPVSISSRNKDRQDRIK